MTFPVRDEALGGGYGPDGMSSVPPTRPRDGYFLPNPPTLAQRWDSRPLTIAQSWNQTGVRTKPRRQIALLGMAFSAGAFVAFAIVYFTGA